MTLRRKCLIFILALFYLTFSSLIYYNNVVWALHPENTWVSKTELPQTTMGLMAASVNGKIYLMGDSINLEYNPATNNWTSKTPMPIPRIAVGIAVYQNKIYTIGGSTGWTQEAGTLLSNVNEVYDPSTDSWETKSPMPTNASSIGAGVVDGKIHLIGCDIHEVYDIALDTWSTEAAFSSPKNGFGSATTVFDNKIYVINENLTQIYDPQSRQWSLGASLPTSVTMVGVCSTIGEMATKRIYAIGGTTGEYGMFTEGSISVQVYDPTNNTWTLGAPMPTGRLGLTVAVANDKIYAFAGRKALVFSPDLTVNEEYTPFGYGTPDISHAKSTSTTTPTAAPEFFSVAIVIIALIIVVILALTLLYNRRKAKVHIVKTS
jgi:N-acetylneuraminic acid mutarotase